MPRFPQLIRSSAVGALVLALFAAAGTRPLGAQDARVRERFRVPDSLHTQVLRLRDGSTLVGRFADVDTALRTGTFVTRLASLTISLADIEEIREIPNPTLREGELWLPNPNTTRLLFAPTGRMLKKGEGYFSVYEVFFPGLAVGVHDRLTIGGGMSVVPGAEEQIFYFTPKVGLVQREDVQIAAGALILGLPSDFGNAGLLYGVGSVGGLDANATVGVGYGYVDGHLSSSPAIMVGGLLRGASRAALITENYFFPDAGDPLVSLGVRFLGDKVAVDFGLFRLLNQDWDIIGFPFVGFVASF